MTHDYKSTLNLPTTAFSMKANLATREPERLAKWADLSLYQKMRTNRINAPKFILHDGPPYANGDIHAGHALNKILKDIVIKSRFLSGFDAPYIPGWDCHGLPIEHQVEKKHGKPGVKLSPAEFRRACRDYATKQVETQREQFKRLGVVGDWDAPYRTMDYAYEADIIRAVRAIVANGHLYKGSKPVHWCIDCGSALAEAEVEYQDKISPSIDVAFSVVDRSAFATRSGLSLDPNLAIDFPIWTTTPWTLPANRAVCLHPKHPYSLIETEKGYLVIAEALVSEVLNRYGLTVLKTVARLHGSDLENTKLAHPFLDITVPVVLGDHVTLDAGTGCVHTAPGHGPDDYKIGLQYGLEIACPVDGKGCLTEAPFVGEFVFQANPKIVELLDTRGKLFYQTSITHSYPHCWRHKTPIIFRATPQWFISMDKAELRSQALNAIESVNWLPDWGKARITGMVQNRFDWCISRQRFWFTPLCLFVHKETGELHPDTLSLMDKVADAVEQKGITAWFELPATDLLSEADAAAYEKLTDTMDVWIDSGVSHFCVMDKRDDLYRPADLYLEGSDQHRGWFQSSLLTSVAMYGEAPYKTVLTHGFIVDANGKKMSKSLKNAVSPDQITKTLGADILRLWVANTDYRGDISISEEILKRTADRYRRLRNTARFLLANCHDFDPATDQVAESDLLSLDRFLLKRAAALQAEIIEAYDAYQFHVIAQKVHHFCTVDLGSFYLDIIKDRQYTLPKNHIARRSAQTVMYHIAESLTRWIAPILSFTAEEIWEHLPGEHAESVLLTNWYDAFPTISEDGFSDADWETIINVRTAVNKALETVRNAGDIGSGLEACVTIACRQDVYPILRKLADELRFVLITSEAEVMTAETQLEGFSETEMAGVWINVMRSMHPKCIRCWHHRADVGSNADHPEICARCDGNIHDSRERRRFA